MDSKFYVSLEAARLLKEKGYNEETDLVTDEDGYTFDKMYKTNQELPSELFSYPTKAEAIDWLESKGVIIEVLQDYRGVWFYVIKISETESYVSESDDNYFPTRLEAEEAAIIKALKFLRNG